MASIAEITPKKKEIKSVHSEKMVDYLSRSLVLEERGSPQFARWTVFSIMTLLVGFVVWANLTPVREVAFASGSILPESFVQPVQHYEGGIVKEITARIGDHVKMGDPIVILDEIAFAADNDQLKIRQAALTYQSAMLRALANGVEPDFPLQRVGYSYLMEEQRGVYQAEIETYEAKLAVFDGQIDEAEAQVLSIERRVGFINKQIEFLEEEIQLRQELFDKKLSVRTLLLEKMQQLFELRGAGEAIASRKGAANQKLLDAKSKRAEFQNTQKLARLSQLSEVTTKLSEITEQVKRLENRVERLTLTAPIDGILQSLHVKSVGAVVGPGERIAEIVPDQSEIVAEIEISPRDIGHIKAGMDVFVKVDTFDFARYGGVQGQILRVSPSSFTKENGQVYFSGIIRLSSDRLMEDDTFQLSPGMTVVADIQTGEKTIMAYLARPIQRALENSFHER